MSFLCLQFPPKNERKQVSSKVEFVRLFFGGIEDTTICFRDYLTFSWSNFVGLLNRRYIDFFLKRISLRIPINRKDFYMSLIL